jgi:hypothetical protein
LLAETTELLDFIPQILLPNLTFQKYSIDKSAGLLRESLFNMEELAQSAINDSQIFLDIGPNCGTVSKTSAGSGSSDIFNQND